MEDMTTFIAARFAVPALGPVLVTAGCAAPLEEMKSLPRTIDAVANPHVIVGPADVLAR